MAGHRWLPLSGCRLAGLLSTIHSDPPNELHYVTVCWTGAGEVTQAKGQTPSTQTVPWYSTTRIRCLKTCSFPFNYLSSFRFSARLVHRSLEVLTGPDLPVVRSISGDSFESNLLQKWPISSLNLPARTNGTVPGLLNLGPGFQSSASTALLDGFHDQLVLTEHLRCRTKEIDFHKQDTFEPTLAVTKSWR